MFPRETCTQMNATARSSSSSRSNDVGLKYRIGALQKLTLNLILHLVRSSLGKGRQNLDGLEKEPRLSHQSGCKNQICCSWFSSDLTACVASLVICCYIRQLASETCQKASSNSFLVFGRRLALTPVRFLRRQSRCVERHIR